MSFIFCTGVLRYVCIMYVFICLCNFEYLLFMEIIISFGYISYIISTARAIDSE